MPEALVTALSGKIGGSWWLNEVILAFILLVNMSRAYKYLLEPTKPKVVDNQL